MRKRCVKWQLNDIKLFIISYLDKMFGNFFFFEFFFSSCSVVLSCVVAVLFGLFATPVNKRANGNTDDQMIFDYF